MKEFQILIQVKRDKLLTGQVRGRPKRKKNAQIIRITNVLNLRRDGTWSIHPVNTVSTMAN